MANQRQYLSDNPSCRLERESLHKPKFASTDRGELPASCKAQVATRLSLRTPWKRNAVRTGSPFHSSSTCRYWWEMLRDTSLEHNQSGNFGSGCSPPYYRPG